MAPYADPRTIEVSWLLRLDCAAESSKDSTRRFPSLYGSWSSTMQQSACSPTFNLDPAFLYCSCPGQEHLTGKVWVCLERWPLLEILFIFFVSKAHFVTKLERKTLDVPELSISSTTGNYGLSNHVCLCRVRGAKSLEINALDVSKTEFGPIRVVSHLFLPFFY